MTRNAVCLCADRKMLVPALFVADSAARSRGSSNDFDVIVFVGPDDAGDEDRAWAADRGIMISDGLAMGQISGIRLQQDRLSAMTLARLLVPEHLADRYDRILYLDADILLDGDIGRIFSLTTRPMAVAAAPAARFWGGSTARREATIEHFRAIGMTEPFRYFNSGVLYVDVAEWNCNDIGRRALAFLRENASLCILPDEDALNAVLDGKVSELSPVWNMRARAWAHSEVRASISPVVVHFDGPLKPWMASARNVPAVERVRGHFQDFLVGSPWPNWLAANQEHAGEWPSPDSREERDYADAFIHYSATHAFADLDQGIVVRDNSRLQLAPALNVMGHHETHRLSG